MNDYLVNIRILGKVITTVIHAESILGARLLINFIFGSSVVVGTPKLYTNESYVPLSEAIKMIKPVGTIKPMDAETANIAALKNKKDQATNNLKVAKANQRIKKSQQQIANLNRG
jgi:hypothetical protein